MIQAGVAGFKCFLIHSGVDEFPHVSDSDLHTAMQQLRDTGSVLLVTPPLNINSHENTVLEVCSFIQSLPW